MDRDIIKKAIILSNCKGQEIGYSSGCCDECEEWPDFCMCPRCDICSRRVGRSECIYADDSPLCLCCLDFAKKQEHKARTQLEKTAIEQAKEMILMRGFKELYFDLYVLGNKLPFRYRLFNIVTSEDIGEAGTFNLWSFKMSKQRNADYAPHFTLHSPPDEDESRIVGYVNVESVRNELCRDINKLRRRRRI